MWYRDRAMGEKSRRSKRPWHVMVSGGIEKPLTEIDRRLSFQISILIMIAEE